MLLTMARPTKTQTLDVRAKVDGTIYNGTAVITGDGDRAMVEVTYDSFSDAAQAGEAGAESVARVILGELVTKSLNKRK